MPYYSWVAPGLSTLAGEDFGADHAGRARGFVHASVMLWFFSGNDRMRLPVAAKIALSTAGAPTKIVGSPTPPQNPPDGMIMHSTFAGYLDANEGQYAAELRKAG